jgi:DNA-binding response OmpR family regulator
LAKVLLIEDDAAKRLLVREALEGAGIALVEAADGQVGLDLARSEQPDLVLLDVGLPVLDGWQVARELLDGATSYRIPLVFLSARTTRDDRERGLRLGARDYITKPFDPALLAERINQILADGGGALPTDPLPPPSLSTV